MTGLTPEEPGRILSPETDLVPNDPLASFGLKNRWPWIGAGLATVGIVAAFLSCGPSDDAPAGTRGVLPAPVRVSIRQEAPGTQTGRSAAPGTAVSDFDQLMELFNQVDRTAPAVQEFAKEFKATPPLEKEFERFEEDQEGPLPKETLETFATRLSQKAEFRALVSRFGQDPGFRQAALVLAQNPRVGEIVRGLVASARAGTRGPARSQSAGVNALAAGRARPGAQPADGRTRNGASAYEPATSPASAASSSPDPSRPEDAKAAASKKSQTSLPGQPEAHDVDPKLASFERSPASEKMDDELRRWLSRHGLNADAFLAASKDGVWDYCFKNNILAQCVAACADIPTTLSTQARNYCHLPKGEYWTACLEAYGYDEVRCLELCQKQKPCVPPDDVVSRLCERRSWVQPSCTQNDTKAYCGVELKPQCLEKKRVFCSGRDGSSARAEGSACTITAYSDPDPVAAASGPADEPVGANLLGYLRDPDGKLVVNPAEKLYISKMYQIFLQEAGKGRSPEEAARSAADWLNKNVQLSVDRQGELGRVVRFDSGQVLVMLQRSAYGGTDNAVKLVDPAVWRRVQAKLNPKAYTKGANKPD